MLIFVFCVLKGFMHCVTQKLRWLNITVMACRTIRTNKKLYEIESYAIINRCLSGVDHMNSSNAVSEKKSSICPVLLSYLFSKFLYVLDIISDSQNCRLNLISFILDVLRALWFYYNVNKYGSSKRTHRRQLEISSVDQRHHLPRVKLAPEETAEKDKQQL